jgi:hypothetical protein
MQEGARLSNVSVVQINDMPRSVSISGVKIFKHLLVIVGSRGFVGVHNTKINTTFVPSQSSHFTESKILSVGLHSFCEQQLLIASGDRLGGLAVWVFDLLACSLDLKLFADIRQPVVCTQFIPAKFKIFVQSGRLPFRDLENILSSICNQNIHCHQRYLTYCNHDTSIILLTSAQSACFFIESLLAAPAGSASGAARALEEPT